MGSDTLEATRQTKTMSILGSIDRMASATGNLEALARKINGTEAEKPTAIKDVAPPEPHLSGFLSGLPEQIDGFVCRLEAVCADIREALY